ncbi:hypothetical protein [Paenibacillus senegalimassiliensis]|nr:hypothetical protein [Paenibacillus senegalimassiliensis]
MTVDKPDIPAFFAPFFKLNKWNINAHFFNLSLISLFSTLFERDYMG